MNARSLGIVFAVLVPVGAGPPFDDGDGLRSALVAVGDLDGDGHADFALAHRSRPFMLGGGPSNENPAVPQRPVVWVLSGASGEVLRSFQDTGAWGSSLAAAGDLDRDGVSEILVGGLADGRFGDRVLILDLKQGNVLRVFEPKVGGLSGFFGGDVQLVGDPTPDLALGGNGVVWVVDGATLSPVEAIVSGPGLTLHRKAVRGWVLPQLEAGESGPHLLPQSVHVLPDMGSDGLGEILITTPTERTQTPSIAKIKSTGQMTSRVLFSDGGRDLLFLDCSAWCSVGGHDLDGDGAADLVTTTVNRRVNAWSSSDGKLLWDVNFEGGYMHAEGTSLVFGDDRNGDGIADLLIGANETFMDADPGSASFLSGQSGDYLPIESAGRPKRAELPGGVDVCVLGDIDGDGTAEIAVTYPAARLVRVLKGSDRSVLWSRTIEDLELKR